MVSQVSIIAVAAVLAVVLCLTEAAPQATGGATTTSGGQGTEVQSRKVCHCCNGHCPPDAASGCSNKVAPKCFQICQKKIIGQHLAVSPSKIEIAPIPDEHLKLKCGFSKIPLCKY